MTLINEVVIDNKHAYDWVWRIAAYMSPGPACFCLWVLFDPRFSPGWGGAAAISFSAVAIWSSFVFVNIGGSFWDFKSSFLKWRVYRHLMKQKKKRASAAVRNRQEKYRSIYQNVIGESEQKAAQVGSVSLSEDDKAQVVDKYVIESRYTIPA